MGRNPKHWLSGTSEETSGFPTWVVLCVLTPPVQSWQVRGWRCCAKERCCAEEVPGSAETPRTPCSVCVLQAPVVCQLDVLLFPFCSWTLAPELLPPLEACSLNLFGFQRCWTPGCALPSFVLSFNKKVLGGPWVSRCSKAQLSSALGGPVPTTGSPGLHGGSN